jgi:hypothetical protein
MMKPNWLDDAYGESLQGVDRQSALRILMSDKKVIAAVDTAIAQHELEVKKHYCGASRSQAIRTAIAAVLNEAS